jgi:hypothetical protein
VWRRRQPAARVPFDKLRERKGRAQRAERGGSGNGDKRARGAATQEQEAKRDAESNKLYKCARRNSTICARSSSLSNAMECSSPGTST